MMASVHREHLTFLNDRISSWLTNLSTFTITPEERLDEFLSCTDFVPPDHRNDVKLYFDSANGATVMTNKARKLDGAQTPVSTKRKRASSSENSYQRAACNRYRAQNAKVVFYDSAPQKLLEKVVEDIGLVKNMIRKEKAMARIRSFCHQGAIPSDVDDDDDLDDDTVMAQVRLRRRKTNDANISTSESSTNMENLDRISKRLDCAQDMCSTAAYQLLRDGDCRLEAGRAVGQLEDVWTIVKDEMAYTEERSLEICSRGLSSLEKEATCNIRPRASIDSENDFPIGPIRLTSR